jgi:PAS domain S-box-containing protein
MVSEIRILHVDDEPNFAEAAGAFLEREHEHFTITPATSAREGLERLDDAEFDCVVSDYDMPGTNGIEFLTAVRQQYSDLPFILFTGKGSEAIASDAISAGVTDYLQKGSGTSQYTVLANRIENAVGKYRAQRQLDDSRKRLNLFFEQSPLGVVEWDENFDLVRMNEAGEEILGYSEAEVRGGSWEQIVPESDRDEVADVVSELLDAEGGYHSINTNIRGDGDRIICEWHNRIVTDDEGDTVAVFSQFQDITERRETRQRLESVIDNLPGYIYRHWNEAGWPLEFVKGSSESVTGYTTDELESDITLAEKIIHPEDREYVEQGVEDGLEADGTYELTYRIITKEGDLRWIWERGKVVDDPVTGDEMLDGFITDVTERKEHERELQNYKRIVEDLPIGVYRITLEGDGAHTFANERAANIFGAASPEQFLTFAPRGLHTDDEQFENHRQRLREEGIVRDDDLRMQTVDGDEIQVRLSENLVEVDGTAYVEGIVRDLTDQEI